MTDDLPWCWIQSRNIVHKLVPIRMTAETINNHHVATHVEHQCLSFVHQWNVRMTFLKPPSKCSRGLISYEAKCISGFGAQCLKYSTIGPPVIIPLVAKTMQGVGSRSIDSLCSLDSTCLNHFELNGFSEPPLSIFPLRSLFR